MTATFRQPFPAQVWRASEPDTRPAIGCDPVETVADWGVVDIPDSFYSPAPKREALIDRPWVNRAFAVALGLAMFGVIASGLGVI